MSNGNNPPTQNQDILDFWNGRALLGVKAGTDDFILTEIEQNFIINTVPENSRVLDIGCGNALSLIRLVREKGCAGVGIDFSDQMVAQSRRSVAEHGLQEKISIHQCTVPPIPACYGAFDVVISNRALINLPETAAQKDAVRQVAGVLKPHGMFVMIECSVDGGEETNKLRRLLGLYPIEPPWHNIFFREEEVKTWQTDDFIIEDFQHISSTYHFLSRVVYAKLAEIQNEALRYDSEINKIALLLPQEIGAFGPVKAWLWRKSGGAAQSC